ncbi:hypothetical protein VHUM_04044 [Vanrija humicola]|uniref:Tc1-like transposase DDE domain-containing protein n=1 Tax=Vanrija humicola TaxID=5417 RepID=A0A7D8UYW7_VANHU|nr:hypothetical protein VHUM_04044 [Vanrija humicola]
MVWAAIYHDGRSELVRFDTTTSTSKRGGITASIYNAQIIQGPLLQHWRKLKNRWRGYGGDNYIVEDNAAVHWGAQARPKGRALGMRYLPHPPSSPDLNPIENLWACLKHRMDQLPTRPSTLDELFEVAQQVWQEIPQDIINRCIISMDDRIFWVYKNRGRPSKY